MFYPGKKYTLTGPIDSGVIENHGQPKDCGAEFSEFTDPECLQAGLGACRFRDFEPTKKCEVTMMMTSFCDSF